MNDTFCGDDTALCNSIEALLSLDAAGALVPHGIGGHARGLLEACYVRLTARTPASQDRALLQQALDADLPVNHDEAAQYAAMHPESNLARCYLDLQAAIAQPAQPAADKCKKCTGQMKAGKAIAQTFSSGLPDFPSDTHGMTVSPGGPGKLIDCLKCEACGWSVTGTSAHPAQPATQPQGGES